MDLTIRNALIMNVSTLLSQKVAIATHLTPNTMGHIEDQLLLKKELQHAVEDDGFDIDLVEEGVEDLEFGEEEDSDEDLS